MKKRRCLLVSAFMAMSYGALSQTSPTPTVVPRQDIEAVVRAMKAPGCDDELLLSRTPAGRWGEADDIAGAVVFLCSPAADFITGAALPVDGG
jgi:NAD(P)-dependent dehydrogenase (short-subunit alcohol dehydrogenase family)